MIQNAIEIIDTAELLYAAGMDVSDLSIEDQIDAVFDLTEKVLNEKGMDFRSVVAIEAQMETMKDRAALNAKQKERWTDPADYPCRAIITKKCWKGGARFRLIMSCTKEARTLVNDATKGHIPTGPFSRTAIVGNRVYGSGVRAIDPKTQKLISTDMGECTKCCLNNLDINMKESGTSLDRVYSYLVYLTDLSNMDTVLNVFRECGIAPETTPIAFEKVEELNEANEIEISGIAYLPE
ncbi:MAG: RidA family protein [Lachnospiraceae bacterium]|nr:RidA family protein [Candidatus Equihabitans merdae]